MDCFLACFGTSENDHNRRKYRSHNQVQPRDQNRYSSFKAVQSPELPVHCDSENPVSSVPEIREKPKEQPNSSPRKKVTFDPNARTYEHVSTHDDLDLLPGSEDVAWKEEKEDLAKSSLAKSSSDVSSNALSLGSYPPNHRYHNCRDSDDELEDFDYGDSDLDDEDKDGDGDGEIEYEDTIFEPKRISDEVNSPMPVSGFAASNALAGLNRNGRDRSGYIHSVLNPVENLTQWKAVKEKGMPRMKPQKENFSLDQESRISFMLFGCREKPKEQPNSSPRKKVTFDPNVRTYEHVSTHEDLDLLSGSEDVARKEEKEDLAKSSLAKSSSYGCSNASSLGSYPPNHRYHNCRDSNDELEDLDYGDSDLDDEDEDEDGDGEIEYEDEIVEPKRISEEFNSPMPVSGFAANNALVGLNQNARDRSGYIHCVLNPVENLAQWKAVKAKGTPRMKPQKENFSLDQESRISFSSEPTFKKRQTIMPKQDMAVDTSLANWLVNPETTPVNKTSSSAFDTRSPDRTTSQGSNSIRSQEDRPILGALTDEEIRQFSATSSPRKSPSRSPDEMPIIETVGTYWNHSKGSPNSFKGIPNTTSQYRVVHWK